jgi:hypothetical protein
VVTGSWESQLVVAAFTDNAGRVWFKEELFTAKYDHAAFARQRVVAPGPTYVVVDRWLPAEVNNATWSFLDGRPWVKLQEACPGTGEMQWKFTLYAELPEG